MKKGFRIISHTEKSLFSISALFKRLRCRVETSRHDGIIYAGFTLIELLVVVLIIGILSAAALPQYEKAVMKSRYAALMDIVDSLGRAEEVYYLANGAYTGNFESLDISLSGCTLSTDKKTCTYPWGECRLNASSDDRVSCVNTQSLNNGYVYYFKNGKHSAWRRSCWSLSGTKDDKYGQLCQAVGASFRSEDGCTSYGKCFVYLF